MEAQGQVQSAFSLGQMADSTNATWAVAGCQAGVSGRLLKG